MKRLFYLFFLIFISISVSGQIKVIKFNNVKTGASNFPIISSGKATAVWVDNTDHEVAKIAASLFADDVERVSNHKPALFHDKLPTLENAILIGTIGKSRLIDSLIESGKLNVSPIINKWESFKIITLKNPLPNVKQALVIVGSDRRGTAFGVLSISEAMGVSPWYWWSDVHPIHQKEVFISSLDFNQSSPSVKYRGIFINDERFGGLAIWAAKKFDPETGNIGPKTYQKVFELLLRLKANYLWPAMHPGTRAFNSFPENAKLADDYAIVMGSSHCEQMLRNNEDEWKAVGTYGPFNYGTNRQTMVKYWEDRVKANARYENTYTLGLRGIHDYVMEGAKTLEEQVSYTKGAVSDQRNMLSQHVNPDVSKVPQVLCAYKEVLGIYQNGLNLPEDVTLLWADDNHGFIRQLSDPKEQTRSGGAGVYYHLSYHGDPESWIWLSSLSPSLIAYEMTKAYEYGANRIWIFNVGDIKPAEKELTFAMQMAWNIKRWTPLNAHNFIKEWASYTFGEKNSDAIASIMSEYYRLAAAGKPSHAPLIDYPENEMLQRIEDYKAIRHKAEAVRQQIPDELQSAYFELVQYPVSGAGFMNEYYLLAKRSIVLASKGDNEAMAEVARSKNAYQQLNKLTSHYNTVLENGKWDYFFDWRQWNVNSTTYDLQVASPEMINAGKRAIPAYTFDLNKGSYKYPVTFANGQIMNSGSGRRSFHEGGGASFSWTSAQEGKTSVWFKSTTPVINKSFKAGDNSFWYLKVNDTLTTVAAKPTGNIWHATAIGPIWNKAGDFLLKKGMNNLSIAQRDSGAVIHEVYVGLYPPFSPGRRQYIKGDSFSKGQGNKEGKIQSVPGLGVSVLPFTMPSVTEESYVKAPWIEYKVNLKSGSNSIIINALPTQRIHEGRGVRYAVAIDGRKPKIFNIQAEEFSPEWQKNVLRGYTENGFEFISDNSRTATIRLYFLDPGVVIKGLFLN